MFRKGRWLHSDRIYSDDEGFFISVGRDWLTYNEGKRRMTITVEMGAKGFAVYLETIGRWDDDLAHPVDDQTKDQIAGKIKRTLESQGQSVVLI
jgi:hypothetical protein